MSSLSPFMSSHPPPILHVFPPTTHPSCLPTHPPPFMSSHPPPTLHVFPPTPTLHVFPPTPFMSSDPPPTLHVFPPTPHPSCLPTHPLPFMSSHPPPFMSSFHLTLHSSRPNTTGHKSIPSVDIVRNYLPDVVVFLITVVTMAIMAHLSKEVSNTEAEPQQTIEGERMLQTSAEQGLVLPNPPSDTKPTSDHCWVVAHSCLDLAIFVMTGACGVSVPSLTSMVYFLLFLLRATLWALHFDKWTRLWSAVRVLLLIYTGCHLVMVYLYQFEKAQELIPLQPTNTTSSLLGRWVSSGSYLLVVREGGGVMAVRDVYT